jgi:signal recognition particle GTPase
MGTSSMYGGPNRSPLLPPDFNDGEGNSATPNQPENPEQNSENNSPDKENKPSPANPSQESNEDNSPSQEPSSNQPQHKTWQQAKSSMSRYASEKSSRNGKTKAVSDYVKGHGGAGNAAKSSKSAIRTTINIGDFFDGISKKGITQVLNEYKIQFEGRKSKEILNDIVNVLAPVPDSNDNAVARKALINTMSVIYEKFEDEKKDISLLDTLDSNISELLITKYIETYIYERLINEVGSRIEKKSDNCSTAAKIEKDIREYIETKVSTTLKDKPLSMINSHTNNVHILVEGLYKQCYKVLEDQL